MNYISTAAFQSEEEISLKQRLIANRIIQRAGVRLSFSIAKSFYSILKYLLYFTAPELHSVLINSSAFPTIIQVSEVRKQNKKATQKLNVPFKSYYSEKKSLSEPAKIEPTENLSRKQMGFVCVTYPE